MPRPPRGFDTWGEITSVSIVGGCLTVGRKHPPVDIDHDFDHDGRFQPKYPWGVRLHPGVFARGPVRPGMRLSLEVDPFGVINAAAVHDPSTGTIERLDENEASPARRRSLPIRIHNGGRRRRDDRSTNRPTQLSTVIQHDTPAFLTTVTDARQLSDGSVLVHTEDGHRYRHSARELHEVPAAGALVTVWESIRETTVLGRTRGIAYGSHIARYLDQATFDSVADQATKTFVDDAIRDILELGSADPPEDFRNGPDFDGLGDL
jgi:hypothetical protein